MYALDAYWSTAKAHAAWTSSEQLRPSAENTWTGLTSCLGSVCICNGNEKIRNNPMLSTLEQVVVLRCTMPPSSGAAD